MTRRIITAREQVELLGPWREAMSPHQLALPNMPKTKVYRGFNLDTSLPGFEKAHALIGGSNPQWDHPELGRHLLDGLTRQGLGRHWSTDPAQAERFSLWPNKDTGRGGNLQAIVEGEWDGGGEDYHRTDTTEFDEHGDRIRDFPEERENTLLPGAGVNVTGLHVRPYDDAYWNGTDDASINRHENSPWRQVLPRPSQRTARADCPHDWVKQGGWRDHPGYNPVGYDEYQCRHCNDRAFFLDPGVRHLIDARRTWLRTAMSPLSWDDIGQRHPQIYGEDGDGEGIGWAANHLAHDHESNPDAEDNSVYDLDFHEQIVHPRHIDFSRAGRGDPRVQRAMQGYRQTPHKMPPLVLVQRHGVYQVADGHHRAEAANALDMPVKAYVAQSPFPNEPFSDATSGPYHGAEPEESNQRTAVWREHPWLDDGNTPVFNDPLDPTADIQVYLRGPEDAYDEYNNGYGSWNQRVHDHPPDPTPTGVDWFHATAADLPVGTVLAPHKGKVPWLDNPYHGGLDNRANWTWVEYDLTHSDEWLGYMVRDHGEGHLYRVKPHIGPYPWNGDAREGWVTDYAVIVERVADAPQQITAARRTQEEQKAYEKDTTLPTPNETAYDVELHPNELASYVWLHGDRPSAFPELDSHIRQHGIQRPLEVKTDGAQAVLTDGQRRLHIHQKYFPDQHVPVAVTGVPQGSLANTWGAAPVGPGLKEWLTS